MYTRVERTLVSSWHLYEFVTPSVWIQVWLTRHTTTVLQHSLARHTTTVRDTYMSSWHLVYVYKCDLQDTPRQSYNIPLQDTLRCVVSLTTRCEEAHLDVRRGTSSCTSNTTSTTDLQHSPRQSYNIEAHLHVPLTRHPRQSYNIWML